MAFDSKDTAAFKGVWVFCEQREGVIMSTSYQLPVSYTHLVRPASASTTTPKSKQGRRSSLCEQRRAGAPDSRPPVLKYKS